MRYVTGVLYAWQHLLLDVAWLKWPVALIGGFMGFLFPTEAVRLMAGITAGAIAIDTITGIRASMKTGEKFESRKLSRLIDKGIAYLSFLYLSASLKYFVPALGDLEQAQVSFVLTGIFLTEGVSIFENARRMGFKVAFGLDKFFKERLLDKPDSRLVTQFDGKQVIVMPVPSKEESEPQ